MATRTATAPRTTVRATVRRTAAEQAEREKTAAPVAKPAKTPANQPRDCACGCGKQTKGGTFFPGHDATLASRLVNLALDGKTIKERSAAEKKLASLGWTSKLERAEASREAKAERLAAAAERKANAAAAGGDGKSSRTPAQIAATARMKAANKSGRGIPKSRAVETEEPVMADEVQGSEFDDEDFEDE